RGEPGEGRFNIRRAVRYPIPASLFGSLELIVAPAHSTAQRVHVVDIELQFSAEGRVGVVGRLRTQPDFFKSPVGWVGQIKAEAEVRRCWVSEVIAVAVNERSGAASAEQERRLDRIGVVRLRSSSRKATVQPVAELM